MNKLIHYLRNDWDWGLDLPIVLYVVFAFGIIIPFCLWMIVNVIHYLVTGCDIWPAPAVLRC